MHSSFLKAAVIFAFLLIVFPGQAKSQTPTNKTSSLGEELENFGRLYKSDSDQIVQEFWLLGRYHGQYHWSDSSLSANNSYESRRTRMGFQARILKSMTIHAQMVSGSDINPFYNGFTELWAQWTFSPEISLTIGQQKNRFTHDRNVSSRYLNYLERATITNMFNVDYTPAVTLQGTTGDISYYTGVFSNATGQNIGDSLVDLDSGYSLLAATYYDLTNKLGTDSAYLYGSYLHSDAKDQATNMNRYDDGLSTALILTKGSASLVTEITSGFSSSNGNVTGINIQPGFFITNKIQLVGRVQVAGSNRGNGVKPQRRYEKEVGLPEGDLYNATYFGANYYLAKHRVKLMTGIEYSSLGGQDALTVSSMFRFYFGPHTNGAFPLNQTLPGSFFESD